VALQRHHVERQLQRRIDAYQEEVLTLQELAPRREQITQRLKGLEQERQQIEQQRDTTMKWEHIASNIEHFRTRLGRNVDRLGFEDRQTVLHLLVEKVVVSRDGAVEVHHVLPCEEQPVTADQKKKGIPPEF
jgi:site-specific DNA recombinase